MSPENAPAGPQAHRFPCDQCGADYRFDPGKGQLVCAHCGHVSEIAQVGPWAGTIRELDLETALAGGIDRQEIEETRVLECPNCGAQVAFDDTIHARECPFCATPVVTGTGTHRHIKPKGLLPFALDEGAAHDAMTGWLGRLWFAPRGLQDYARKGRRMQGIYVPYWTFDADTESRYRGARGTVYHETRTVMRNGKRRQVRVQKVRWQPVSGRVARFFDDVLVLASRTLPKRHTDGLAPWDLAALEPYRPEFLAGFGAEGYQVELDEGFAEARAQMDRVIARDVRFDIGGDRQRIHDIETTVRDVTFKHILLPVWVAAYRYRGESYRFVVNGRTGRVQGERPWCVWKIALAVALGLLVAGGAGYFIAINEGAIP
ncbi:TFIIB-type zinc finger domain-containing protein [Roseovarius salis]|uniref:TFIIB-type zinc finger domain-containing protein n=1 Tax=Roseovarius salis TaxID=3376063 RepID=UPI0037CA8D0B